ncbi:hypothetical protein YC2023_002048 [Brassica napus]
MQPAGATVLPMVLTSALEVDLLEIISKNVALPRGQLSPSSFLIAAWSVFTFRNPYDCLHAPTHHGNPLSSLMSLRKLFLIPVYVLNTLGEICF